MYIHVDPVSPSSNFLITDFFNISILMTNVDMRDFVN
jgi:hypothetical protein